MPMFQHIHALEEAKLDAAWLAIGSFDGVHLGHQAILHSLVSGAAAQRAPSVVVTFFPHPSFVLRGRQGRFYLTMPEERAAYAAALGVNLLVTLRFDQALAETSARDFILELKRWLGLRQLLVGPDFAFGRGREVDVSRLKLLGDELNFGVQIVDAVMSEGEVVSSSRIREALDAGEVGRAAGLLGRRYSLTGEVIKGDQRGRTIGFPTANLAVDEKKLIPGAGVYACQAWLGEEMRPAAVNIGYRPTFDGSASRLHVEAHLLGYQGDLYGRRLNLSFVERLRNEQRFANLQELVAQILSDVARTSEIVPG